MRCNRSFYLIFAILFGLISPTFALAAAHGSAPLCPFSGTASVDGCIGAPFASSLTVIHTDFFTSYARQSGQTWPSGAGNTGTGNPGLLAPHPGWNVAGVDYHTGINPSAFVFGTDPAGYDRNTDATTPGYGLKLFTAHNLHLDGLCATNTTCATNGCYITGSDRLQCTGTIPTHTGCTVGSNCILINGYDWTDQNGEAGDAIFMLQNAVTTSQLLVENCYIAPGPATFSQDDLISFSSTAPAIPVTYQYNYIDSLSGWANLQSGSPGNSWPGNNYQQVLMVGASTYNQAVTSNEDCGAGTNAAICIQYNAIVNASPRWFAVSTNSCLSSCSGTIFQFNYVESGPNIAAKFEGWVDDGQNTGCGAAPCYDGIAGACLTISSVDYGYPAVDGTGTGAITEAGPNILSANLVSSTVYYMALSAYTQICNASATTSFALSSSSSGNPASPPAAIAALGPFYMNGGTHGDPIFFSFGGTVTTYPEVQTLFNQSYNTELFPINSSNTTGAVTFNTSTGTSLRAAKQDNCNPTCGSGNGAGNTLTVTNVVAQSWPSGTALFVGMTIPGVNNPYSTSPFPAGGTQIIGSGTSAATCDNGFACTGTGGNGTYLVSGSAEQINFSGTLELSASTISDLEVHHNVLISNTAPLFATTRAEAWGAAIGDNHGVLLSTMNIFDNYYDAVGSIFCVYPIYPNLPAGGGVTTNVNLRGNGSGAWDTASNAPTGCYGSNP